MLEEGPMNKPWRFLGLVSCLATIVVSGGCLSATFVPTQAVAYPPKSSSCEIEVFSSAVPDREYEEIGIVEGEGSAWKSGLDDILPKIMEEGCLAGGDAVIVQSSNTFSEGEAGIPVQRISATVIRWKTE
jgi:hypothetical protein